MIACARLLLRRLIASCIAVLFVAAFTASGAIIISQYYEGTSNNKWIELYNTSSDPVDLSAGDYRLGVWANANREAWKLDTAPLNTIVLSGTIPGNGTFCIAHTSAALPSYAVSNQASGSLSHNGDDSVVLFTGSTYAFANVVDAFGLSTTIGATNKSLVRNPAVVTGVNTDLNPSDWTEFSNTDVDNAAPNTLQYIGYHATGGGGTDPTISVSPSGAFGSVISNTTTNVVFTISNNGAASNLVIQTPLSINGEAFAIAAQPGLSEITPGGSTTFSVDFAPLAVTAYVGSIQISNNSATAVYALNLSGSGVSGVAPPPAGFWHESFDYPDGNLTNVSSAWLPNTGTDGLLVVPGALPYTDYPGTGKKLAFGSGSQDARRSFTDSTLAYASFLMQVDRVPTTSNGDYLVSFQGNYGTRMFITGEADNGTFRPGISSSSQNLTWHGTELPTGVVHRFILKFDSVSSNFNLWVNPSLAETTPDVSVTPAGSVNATSFAIRQGGALDNGASEIYFDEIIVGTSWDAVQIPEPLAGAALLFALAAFRRLR